MSTNTPSPQTAPNAAAIVSGARTSILTMAYAGLIAYVAILILTLAFGTPAIASAFKQGHPNRAAEAIRMASILALIPYSLYGVWGFRKLLRCGRLLTSDGANLGEALALHRQFWTHAPFLSGLGLLIALSIFFTYQR